MKFKSDSQRKAIFANLNSFSVKPGSAFCVNSFSDDSNMIEEEQCSIYTTPPLTQNERRLQKKHADGIYEERSWYYDTGDAKKFDDLNDVQKAKIREAWSNVKETMGKMESLDFCELSSDIKKQLEEDVINRAIFLDKEMGGSGELDEDIKANLKEMVSNYTDEVLADKIKNKWIYMQIGIRHHGDTDKFVSSDLFRNLMLKDMRPEEKIWGADRERTKKSIEALLAVNGFDSEKIELLNPILDRMSDNELNDNLQKIMSNDESTHLSGLTSLDRQLPESNRRYNYDSYTFKKDRQDARENVMESFNGLYKGEELLNTVPIEKSHNKAVEIPDTKPNEPERYGYQKMATLSAVKNQDSPTGVTYVLRQGKAQGGVGFIEDKSKPVFMTFEPEEAYTKLNGNL
jgi:translation initiation factor 2 beta subunit (eIF-2beta)/eIF-5